MRFDDESVASGVRRRFCRVHRDACVDQTGAVLAIVGLTMTLILMCGAIAVDLSALDRQGQVLQNTADSAALAGATIWGSTQDRDEATIAVHDMVRQNGVDVGVGGIELQIQFESPTQLTVELTDTEPTIYLAGLVGMGSDLVRDATGEHLVCEDGCLRSIDVPEPQRAISAEGSGDGFLPILTEDRVYAVNHHNSTIECVDRTTESICWPARELFADPVTTMNLVHAEVIGDRIYFLAWRGSDTSLPFGDGELRLGCWNLTADNRCGTFAEMRNVGHGTMYATDDAIYVFAANRDVYCYRPVTFAECSTYAGGVNTDLTSDPGWGTWNENRAWNGDRIAHDDKVYVTLSRRGAVYLHCFDTGNVAPCDSFGVHLLHGTREGTNGDYTNGRLFLHRDRLGVPTSVCSMGVLPVVECFDFDSGTKDTAAEGALSATMSSVVISVPGTIGVASYHAPSNSVYFVSTFEQSVTYCYSFTEERFCGELYTTTPFGPTKTYGYVSIGNCLLGLGDTSVLFTLAADLSGPCKEVATSIDLEPCACTGGLIWPPISIENADGVETFRVRIVSPDGDFLYPDDGSWIELREGTELDLSPVPLDYPYVTVEMEVVGEDDGDPWADGIAPSLLVGRRSDDPILVE